MKTDIHIQIDTDLLAQLTMAAKKDRRSRNSFILMLIEKALGVSQSGDITKKKSQKKSQLKRRTIQKVAPVSDIYDELTRPDDEDDNGDFMSVDDI